MRIKTASTNTQRTRTLTTVRARPGVSQFSILNSQFRGGAAVAAFSLAELMIAIVILGIGLLIVAGMFPVAWMKARDQVEVTNLSVATSSAETLLKMKLLAARHNPQKEAGDEDCTPEHPDNCEYHTWFDRGSLLGDLGLYPVGMETCAGSGVLHPGFDNRVHPIHVYNRVADPAAYPSALGSRGLGDDPHFKLVEDVFAPEHPHEVDHLTTVSAMNLDSPQPVLRLEDRLIPPVLLRPDTAGVERAQWDAVVRTRRYCWAVLAKLNNQTDDPGTPNDVEGIAYLGGDGTTPKRDTWDDPRIVTVYYVTLRRGQETFRFPQQEFERPGIDWPDPDPEYAGYKPAAKPKALPPAWDTVFPTSWRVPLWINASVQAGVPAEAEVNTTSHPSSPIVVGLLPRGAYMIDERNGNVYRVVRQTLTTNTFNQEASLVTLDREVDANDLTPPSNGNLRTVWVFPPPVEVEGRDTGASAGSVVFAGTQPVVGIEIRSLILTP